MGEAALLPKDVEAPSPMPPNKRPLEPSNEPTTEDHPPKRPAVDLRIKPAGDTMDSHIDLTCLPKTESKGSQSPSPKSTGERESSDPITSMTNEELEESVKARLPTKAHTSAEIDGSAAPAIGISLNDLTKDVELLRSLLRDHIHEMNLDNGIGPEDGRELREMSARIEAVSNTLTAMTEDLNDFLGRWTVVHDDDFLEEEEEEEYTPGDSETRDLESFTEGGYNNPMRIEEDETHVIN